MNAVISPNNSTPTSPPPMMTNVSSFRLRSGSFSTSACRRNTLLNLARPPGVRLVFIDRAFGLEHWLHDAPRLLHIILASKQGGVSFHGVPEQPFVSIHLPRAGVLARQQF